MRVMRQYARVSLMAPTDTLIGSAEAARILGKSPRTIHRLVEAGTLVPVLTAPGGAHGVYMFERADIEALANSEKRTA